MGKNNYTLLFLSKLKMIDSDVAIKNIFDGQIYDEYSIIIDITKKANNKILIIDNYIDDTILKTLTKKKNYVEVVILISDKKYLGKKCFVNNENIEIIEKIINL